MYELMAVIVVVPARVMTARGSGAPPPLFSNNRSIRELNMFTVLDGKVRVGASSLSSTAALPTQSEISADVKPVIVEWSIVTIEPGEELNVPGNFRTALFRIVKLPATVNVSLTYAFKERGSVVMMLLSRMNGLPAVTVSE